MVVSLNSVARLAAAGLLLGAAVAGQAATVTLSAEWDTTGISGSFGSGATTFTSVGLLAAGASQSWDTVADLGQTRTYTFTAPFSMTVADTAPFLEAFIKGTPVNFTGAGVVTAHSVFNPPLFTQGIGIANPLGTEARITYTDQGPVTFASVSGSTTYEWSAHFVAQPEVQVPFSGGQASYSPPSVSLEVTLLSAVPEAGTAPMLALGLVPLAVVAMRRRRRD